MTIGPQISNGYARAATWKSTGRNARCRNGRQPVVQSAQEYRPLTQREMRVYLCLLTETMDAAALLAAQLRAIQIIDGMEATEMPIDPHFTLENPPELPMYERGA